LGRIGCDGSGRRWSDVVAHAFAVVFDVRASPLESWDRLTVCLLNTVGDSQMGLRRAGSSILFLD
jgi:hypothetical protein